MGKKTLDNFQTPGKKVLSTDELKFEVFGSYRRTFVRCRTNEKMLKCLTPSVDGGNVMFWGYSGAGKVEFVQD